MGKCYRRILSRDFDEVRFGTTWASVVPVPEPATIFTLLMGLAVVGYFSRRR